MALVIFSISGQKQSGPGPQFLKRRFMSNSTPSGVIMRSFIDALIQVNVRSGGICFSFVNTQLKKKPNSVAASGGESSTPLFTIGNVYGEECLGIITFRIFFGLFNILTFTFNIHVTQDASMSAFHLFGVHYSADNYHPSSTISHSNKVVSSY